MDSLDLNVRSSSMHLLEEIAKAFKKGGGSSAVYAGASMCIEESQGLSVEERWRLKEAGLLALGEISSILVQVSTSTHFACMLSTM